jgi:RNA polymerase sigma factor (TIGR02999 family)
VNPLQLNIDQILKETETGNRKAASQLFEYVYDELRHLANRELRREPSGITLQATALVNEVWLKLIGNNHDPKWNSRDHLLLAAANAMRRILVDAARARKRKKRGGKDQNRLALNDGLLQYAPDEELLNLNEALDELSLVDPVKADLVKLRYFAGLTNAEASRHLAISTATAERYWVFARAWLRGKMD